MLYSHIVSIFIAIKAILHAWRIIYSWRIICVKVKVLHLHYEKLRNRLFLVV